MNMRNRLVHFPRSQWLWTIILASVCMAMVTTDSYAQRKKKKVVTELSVYDIDTLLNPIPIQRRIWHDKIDKAQRAADAGDGSVDHIIYFGEDTVATNLLTEGLLREVDKLQIMIENLPFTDNPNLSAENQMKIHYLTSLEDMLRKYNNDLHVDPVFWARTVVNFQNLVIAQHEGKLMDFIQSNANLQTFTNLKLYERNAEAKAYMYRVIGKEYPAMMIKRLAEYASEPFACDVIAEAAKVVPNEVFNYASSTNYTLNSAIKRCNDPLVQTILRIAQQSKAPLKAMSFLNDIYTKRFSIEEIDKITANQDLFFKNLVRLKLENQKLGDKTFSDELQYRGLAYVRDMNDLHEEKDPVRFKGIDGLKPEELYFIMVYGQDEIYTSSFLGTFRRMMQRMDSTNAGEKLLERVHYDKFRTFIRMCAGYNTLGTYLASMPGDKKTNLMKDFIANLDQGKDEELEDAVDVADAFGSITDSSLVKFLKQQVRDNYELSFQRRSMKGMRVYALLTTLFEGLKGSEDENLMKQQSEVLQLPPINKVKFDNLTNDSGIVYQQFFFYGDEDGKNSYNSFMGNFKDGKWKTTSGKYWTTIESVAGKKVMIYANLPLAEPEDEEAQKQLCDYLAKQEIMPSVIVHRGHSYHLPLTLERLNKNARIVMLGSCGGYHNLGKVLDASPDAHIISSKQTGAMSINEPIIKAINGRLLEGKDVNWIPMWRELNTFFSAKGKTPIKEMFDDYVPPHKNLGAIFIKAYRKMTTTEAEI